MDVKIQKLTEPAELFRHYEGQTEQQPCHLALGLGEGVLWCDYNPNVGPPYGMPESEWLGQVRTVQIPCLTADMGNMLMAEVAPLAQKVLEGASIEWSGRQGGRVGLLDEAASDAWGQLCDLVAAFCQDPGARTVEGVDAGAWYSQCDPTEELGITADTTDEELERLVAQVEEEIREQAESVGGLAVPLRVAELLEELRRRAGE